MDPHSRLFQFNNRPPRAGPLTQNTRPSPMDRKKQTIPRKQQFDTSTLLLAARPIATNSRVKKTQKLHRDMHLAFVNNALERKSQGDSEDFDELVRQFNFNGLSNDAPAPTPQLRLWISALSHVVSRLERVHSALPQAIITMPWTTMDSQFVRSYTSFIGMLVSARPEYLSLVLERIVRGLTYDSGTNTLNSAMPESSSAPLTRRTIYDRLHYLLRHLLALIPTLPSTLQNHLIRHFPHKRLPLAAQVTYIRNILRTAKYCPDLADRILATIVDRVIQIDVEIQVELEEIEDNLDSAELEEVFELDPFDTVVGQEEVEEREEAPEDDQDDFSDLSSEAEEAGEPTNTLDELTRDFHHIRDMVNKLDTILVLVFGYLDRPSFAAEPPLPADSPPTESPPSTPLTIESQTPPQLESAIPLDPELEKAVRRSQFHALLSIFDRTIIRTFKSRYTQFLIFWYSSLDPEFSDLFQGMLVEKALLDENLPMVTRISASSYISSFVSRATFVDKGSTRNVVSVLCDFLTSRMDALDQTLGAGGGLSGTYCGMFYAVCQAVFLIFCFRWRDLIEDQVEDVDELAESHASRPAKKWLPRLYVLERAVASSLNPLRHCASNIVMQFARVAHATDLIYCYPILEANKRSPDGEPSQRTPARQTFLPPRANTELNTFFPFDPYKLPKSCRYIDGVYREWSTVAIDGEDEEEDEDDEDEGVDVDSSRNGVSIVRTVPPDPPVDNLGDSFEAMSISPVRQG